VVRSIFSYLFSDDSTQIGARQGGKGDASLVSMGNVDASEEIRLQKDKGDVKGKKHETPEKKVAQQAKSKSDSGKQMQKPNKSANRRRKNMRKIVRTRTLELIDKENTARDDVKSALKSTINKSEKIKAVKNFLEQLPPETQDLIKKQIKQKVLPQTQEKRAEVQADKKQEQISKRELLEQKRGVYRQEQTALRLAKMAAEKARNMVKSFRDRVLHKKPAKTFEPNSAVRQNKQNTASKIKQRQKQKD